MACKADTAAAHCELARCIESIPSVESADHLGPELSASGRAETEIVVRRTPRGTLPNSVVSKICQSSLGIASLTDGNHPDYLRVVVR